MGDARRVFGVHSHQLPPSLMSRPCPTHGTYIYVWASIIPLPLITWHCQDDPMQMRGGGHYGCGVNSIRTARRLGVSGCVDVPRRAGDAAGTVVEVLAVAATAVRTPRAGAGEAVLERTAAAGPVSGGARDSPLGTREPDLRLVGVVLPSWTPARRALSRAGVVRSVGPALPLPLPPAPSTAMPTASRRRETARVLSIRVAGLPEVKAPTSGLSSLVEGSRPRGGVCRRLSAWR